MPNLVLGQTLPNVLQYHAQPSALNIILAEGLVFHLLPEVFHLRQQPFLPLQQHQPGVHCLPCQARGRDGRSRGCQGPGVIPSGAKCQEPELPSVRSLENQQLACNLCHVVAGTTIRDTSPCVRHVGLPRGEQGGGQGEAGVGQGHQLESSTQDSL